ncbi:MAG TPA: hypothetical protein VF544_18585 [Pyrinomonadaceae bacterium]|jgi:hypothetical protein
MNGSTDVFVIRIDPTQPAGQQLVYATFIRGSASERGRAVAPLADGRVYITGAASNFMSGGNAGDATSGSYQASFAGGEYDGFLVKLGSESTRYESSHTSAGRAVMSSWIST